jgi:hypothetical protein
LVQNKTDGVWIQMTTVYCNPVIHLLHSSQKEVGAAVMVRNNGYFVAAGCSIVSQNGFGLWAVQSARIRVLDCLVTSWQRSGVVCFGKVEWYLLWWETPKLAFGSARAKLKIGTYYSLL